MKRPIFVFTLCIGSHFCCGQHINGDSAQVSAISEFDTDSMMQLLEHTPEGTLRCDLLGVMSFQFAFVQADKAVSYGQEGIQLSQKLGYRKGTAKCSQSLGMAWWGLGNYGSALQAAISALHIYEELSVPGEIAFTRYILANIYRDFGDYSRAMDEIRKGSAIYKTLAANDFIGHGIKGSIFDLQDQLDSANYHVQKSYELNELVNKEKWPWLYFLKGNICRKRKQYDSALYYYRAGLPLVYNKDLIETYNGLALLYYETGQIDSCIYYASQVLQKWKYVSYQRGILQSSNILADAYKKINQRDSAIKYFELGVALNNNMFDQRHEKGDSEPCIQRTIAPRRGNQGEKRISGLH
jgi:tetratricopeptide (TPR) repeat protein